MTVGAGNYRVINVCAEITRLKLIENELAADSIS